MTLFIVLLIIFIFQDSISLPTLPYHTMEVFGNASLGYYYATLYYGLPPQPQSVILDTGSKLLITPCNKCKECGPNHINSYFDISKSKTSKFITCGSKSEVCKQSCKGKFQQSDPCKFQQFYSEGSSHQGIFLEDNIQLQSNTTDEGVRIEFGCSTRETNLFYTQKANGILGLSPSRSLIFEKLTKNHTKITGEKLQFSLCLSSNGGYLNVGGVNPYHHTQPSIIARFKSDKALYTIEGIRQIKIGSHTFHQQSQDVGIYGIFIDSGSTISYIPMKQYNSLINELNKLCFEMKNCLEYKNSRVMHSFQLNNIRSKEQLQMILIEKFPSITIQIKGQKLDWSPLEYFFLRDDQKFIISLGVQGHDRFLLGSNWMVNKDILFDIDKNNLHIYPDSNCGQAPSSYSHPKKHNKKIAVFLFPYLAKKRHEIQINKPKI